NHCAHDDFGVKQSVATLLAELDLEHKLINILLFFAAVLRGTWPHLEGLTDALTNRLAGLICHHVLGTEAMLPRLQLLASIARYKKSGVGDMLREIDAWWSFDAPDPPSIMSSRSATKVLLYHVLYTWAVLDFDALRDAVLFLAWPAVFQTLFWAMFYLFSGDSTTQAPEAILRWVRDDGTSCVAAYGCGAYALAAFRGHVLAPGGFVAACWVMSAIWPLLTAKEKHRLMFVIAFPLEATEFLIKFPYSSFWPWRHYFRMPLWRARHRCRSWCRSVKQRDPRVDLHEPYKYTPLRGGEIRLVQAWRVQGVLQCRILCVQLDDDDAPSYDAISYTWGPPKPLKRVMVAGGRFQLPVTQSAYEILQDRTPWPRGASKLLWIDSICINQTDHQEKNVQVPMMGKIYSRAARVVVCLEPSPDAEAAFSLLRDLNDRLQRSVDPARDEAEADLHGVLAKVGATRSERWSNFNYFDSRYEALAQLLAQRYFLRVWIVQEVFFGRAVHVRCDGLWITWDQFAQPFTATDPRLSVFLGMDRLFAMLSVDVAMAAAQISKIFSMRQRREETARQKDGIQLENLTGPPLCKLLCQMGHTQATNPRDLIYGHLSLSQDADCPDFAPDYAKETETIYQDFATLFLQRGELPPTLYRAGIGHSRQLTTLPSWVADWTSTPTVAELEVKPYSASGSTHPIIKQVLNNPRQISVRGVFLDKVTRISLFAFNRLQAGQFPPESTSTVAGAQTTLTRYLRAFAEADKLVSALPAIYDATQQPRDEAFWRTLIGDVVDGRELDLKRRLASEGISPHHVACPVHPAGQENERHHQTLRRMLGLASVISGDEGETRPPPTMAGLQKAVKPYVRELFEEVRALEADGRFLFAMGTSMGRKFATTEEGMMALVPPLAREGDDLLVLHGLKVPFAVRRKRGCLEGVFELVGPCYVHGFMDDGRGILSRLESGSRGRNFVFE
ncbi:heterokaryon incompatibility protein-domain-containing protein, partial [Podospora aff. communis PSN243]